MRLITILTCLMIIGCSKESQKCITSPPFDVAFEMPQGSRKILNDSRCCAPPDMFNTLCAEYIFSNKKLEEED